VLPYERLEVYWLAEEYAAFLKGLIAKIREVSDNEADQLERALGSMPNNISEGAAKLSRKERIRFFGYARSSASECHSVVRRHVKPTCLTEVEERISYSYADRISAMLYNLMRGQ
jgi:four helix bundle protein